MFTVIKADNFASFNAFNDSAKLYTTVLPNATNTNWQRLAENISDVVKQDGEYYTYIDGERRKIFNAESLNDLIQRKVKFNIFKLAEKKARS